MTRSENAEHNAAERTLTRHGKIPVSLKLYASLTQYLPGPYRKSHAMPMEVDPAVTIEGLVAPLGLPPPLIKLVILNGLFVPPAIEPRNASLMEMFSQYGRQSPATNDAFSGCTQPEIETIVARFFTNFGRVGG